MKRQLNVLLKEMDERLKYLMERVDSSTNEEMESYYTGKYCELDKVYKELKEILKKHEDIIHVWYEGK